MLRVFSVFSYIVPTKQKQTTTTTTTKKKEKEKKTFAESTPVLRESDDDFFFGGGGGVGETNWSISLIVAFTYTYKRFCQLRSTAETFMKS